MALPIYDDIPELSTEAKAIARRRKIAEMMLAQSQEQIPANQMAGQVVAPVSWTQGLAKLANAYIANKQNEDADKAEQGLANKRQQMVADQLAKIQQLSQGSPGVEGIEAQPERTIHAPAPMQEGQIAPNYNTVPKTVPAVAGRAAVPAVPPNKRQAIMDAIMSNLPEVQRYGTAMTAFEEMDSKNAQLEAARKEAALQKQLDREARIDVIREQIASREAMGQQTNDLRAAIANLQAESRLENTRLAASLRPEKVDSPTMTEVVDPSDPSRLLRVDAKTYRGGSLGSNGVLGISGKEPVAAKKEEQASKGKQALSDSISTLRGFYDTLDANNAIVNPDKGALSNIKAWTGSTGVGQVLGGMVGTNNQTARDNINMQRPLLLQAIKEATGMSAKQMDSNAELKLWLNAATDPQKSIKANKEALDSIERKYLNGENISSGKIKPAGNPDIDKLLKKYK